MSFFFCRNKNDIFNFTEFFFYSFVNCSIRLITNQ